ncbi:hypothetical protein GGS20DRAFT_594634 [Poronia punctata]|nr:hypothetical protein GGS20DRAFT_594634 [Poronia punctata]
MDAASTAINKMFHKGSSSSSSSKPREPGSAEAPTLDQRTAPAVEHETVQRQHEQREQTVIDKERHQDHYRTTVQPLEERQVMPEEHRYEQAEVQHRHFQHDRDHEAKLAHERQQQQFQDATKERDVNRKSTREPAMTSEHVHHHLHETIQPVVEKVTHKTVPVKETHQERGIDEGISVNKPISKAEFEDRLRK